MEEKLQLHSKSSYRYAIALLKLSEQQGVQKSLLSEVENLVELHKENKMLDKLFASPLINSKNQIELINALFSMSDKSKIRVSKTFFSFLMIVAKNSRLNILISILINFKNMLLSQNKELKVYVTSAVSISDSLRNDMKKAFSDKLNTKVSITNNVNKDILGG